MNNLIGKKFLVNEDILVKEDFLKIYSCDSRNVYEVIRVIDSKILFWDEHFKRFNNSISKFLGWEIEIGDLFEKVHLVINENKIVNGNVKIEIIFDDNCNLYVYPIKFYYPDDKFGVDVVTFNFERKNPNIKTYDYEFREKSKKIIDDKNVYEVLLVNKEGFITEGSKTNVYFIKDNCFFTAPENLVLNGVTRINVNKLINELGFNLKEESVSREKIFDFDACFLTSTSSNVLAVDVIDGKEINSSSNTYFNRVKERFKKYLEN